MICTMMMPPDPEQAALELLESAKQKNRPVDLDQVAALWPKLRISIEKLDREGYLIDLGKQGAEIIVREGDDVPRRRYTIAHELGHCLLKSSAFRDAGDSPDSVDAEVEKWCDQFAAALLMPREWVVRDLREAKVGGLIYAVRSAPHLYQVSHHSFRLRVSEVTPISIFEVEQTGRRFELGGKFEARGVSSRHIRNTLQEALDFLGTTGDYSWRVHPNTQFLSICKPISHGSGSRRYLFCIMPKPEAQKSVENGERKFNQAIS
jgi:Zn-dependent peptidase ImmA (M78 family)